MMIKILLALPVISYILQLIERDILVFAVYLFAEILLDSKIFTILQTKC